MKIHDISLSLYTGMPVYPGDPPVVLKAVRSISEHEGINISFISMGSHTGTHMDAPFHYFEEGFTVDNIPLSRLIGPAKVIEVKTDKIILPIHFLDKSIEKGDNILFKTSNSNLWVKEGFQKDFVYLSMEAAEYLAEKKVNLVGIDYLSIDSYTNEESPNHRILLSENIIILEGLDLSNVQEGEYILLTLPLKLKDCDGSPVRAVLVEGYK